jgi:scyllo-inositol 2-dehydrogenase (NADP+)
MVDWTLLLMNRRIEWVAGFFRKARWHDVTNEDHTDAVIRFEDGAKAEIFFSYLGAAPKPVWCINGTHGAILEENLAQGHIRVWSDRCPAPLAADPLPSATEAGPHQLGASPHLALPADADVREYRVAHGKSAWNRYYANLADHLLHAEPLLVPAEDARRVIAVLETAEKSAQAGRPLPVPGESA